MKGDTPRGHVRNHAKTKTTRGKSWRLAPPPQPSFSYSPANRNKLGCHLASFLSTGKRAFWPCPQTANNTLGFLSSPPCRISFLTSFLYLLLLFNSFPSLPLLPFLTSFPQISTSFSFLRCFLHFLISLQLFSFFPYPFFPLSSRPDFTSIPFLTCLPLFLPSFPFPGFRVT